MKKRSQLITVIVILVLVLAVLIFVASKLDKDDASSLQDPQDSSAATESTADPTLDTPVPTTTQPTTEPTEPPIVKEATATIGATGDILLHELVIKSGYDSATGTYNYDEIFTLFREYVSGVDYAVANLEVTLCGDDNGYAYSGYPCFNSPDAIVDALKEAGFDMLLTANNHTYDTRSKGMLRTQQVISDAGLNYIGTRQNAGDANYSVVDVNGIRIGMINYTYNTSQDSDGTISLNGISLTNEASQLVNSFNYYQLDSFYAKLQTQLDAMRAEGAEAIVVYIHWGDEYQTTPNANQTKIAQALCNMGVDVIVGNHAHVPQGTDLLTSEQDENHKTVCLYSTGNAISNIYRGSFPVNTEDGMLFTFTFAKYSDGTVVVESADVLPTWVYRYYDNAWTRKFLIMTLDDDLEDWKTAMDLTDSQLSECEDSFERTMGIVGEGLEKINTWCQENQAAVEAALGIE